MHAHVPCFFSTKHRRRCVRAGLLGGLALGSGNDGALLRPIQPLAVLMHGRYPWGRGVGVVRQGLARTGWVAMAQMAPRHYGTTDVRPGATPTHGVALWGTFGAAMS